MKTLLRKITTGALLLAAVQAATIGVRARSLDAPLSVEKAKTRLASIRRTVSVLNGLIAQTTPDKLSQAEQQQWRTQTEWFRNLSKRYSAHADELDEAIRLGGPDTAARLARLNTQFAALQEATQMESRKFQTLSNASKTRHEAAMSSIRNIRA
ncbi:MAG TPA: hypothetical protein VGW36_02620 [Pyrinomonadaceae bacterium]|nr:hypothetical protein [Pyrinomonadaceae bacterium]